MSRAARFYTAAEAAAVSGIGLKAVHNAIDKHIVGSRAISHRHDRRALTGDDLVRLKLWHGIGAALPNALRQRLFDAVAAEPLADMVRADPFLLVDVGAAREQVATKLRELDEAEAAVEQTDGILGGEPVFTGTRIPVRAIADMLAQGASPDEILDGYPALTAPLLQVASLWSAAHPRRGRPKTLADHGLEPKTRRSVALGADPLAEPMGRTGQP